ncbi:hypothetical protein GCM10023185_06390 [Hymenobacter saemangeumensis]|uniref:Gliding motility-associated C-terminal domain-containing protein n=1 Tax=Hymenobacter saemangeumensis TaxID=1084522 RepID=A0ABP8I1R7_9BACT
MPAARVFQFTAAAIGGSGTFTPSPNVWVGSQPYIIVTADVNGDGAVDFLTPNFNSNTVSVCLNNGTGTFTMAAAVPVGNQPRGLALADIDGDGDLDILTSNYSGNTASVRFNNGAGAFAGGTEVPAGIRPQSVSAADVDGDGDLDMLVSSEASSDVRVSLNNGIGIFTAASTIAGLGFPFSLTMADVDSDGDIDMLSGRYNSNTVSIRLNNGSGLFSGGSDPVVGSAPRGLTTADVDGDGDLDLLTANAGSNSVSVRLNNGAGVFGSGSEIAVGNFPSSVTTADLDGDGDLDMLCTNILSNTVSISLNNGNGTFAPVSTLMVGADPYRVALADFDNDNDLDIAVANFASSNVSIFLNRPSPYTLAITGDSLVCNGGQVQLTAIPSAPPLSYRWNTGATTASIPATSSGAPSIFSVTATFPGGITRTVQRRVYGINPTVQIAGDSVLCPAGPATLTATASSVPGLAFPPSSFRWSTGATTPGIQIQQPGIYSVTAFFGSGCSVTTQKRVRSGATLPSSVSYTIGADTTLCEGNSLLLQAPVLPGAGIKYRWFDGSTGTTLWARQEGAYSLQISSDCDSRMLTRRISISPCLNIPNVFTPNGDQFNSLFAIAGLQGGNWALVMYNRWGVKVYSTSAYRNDWGAEAAAGLYYYLLENTATRHSYKGWVEVIR